MLRINIIVGVILLYLLTGCGGGSGDDLNSLNLNYKEISVLEDSSAIISIDNQDIEITTQPTKGVLSFLDDSIIYTPDKDFFGVDIFRYDRAGESVEVKVVVEPVNDAPVAYDSNLKISKGYPTKIELNVKDVDGDNLEYILISQPKNGILEGTPPHLTYTPKSGFIGSDSFEFKVKDRELESNIAIVSLDIKDFLATITGKVTYDYVPNSEGLDYNSIVKKAVRGAIVKLIDKDGLTLQTTSTDRGGYYQFSNIPLNSDVRVRVEAKLLNYDIKVVDNTADGALYVMDGSLIKVESDQVREFNAKSGWVDGAYREERTSAPFALLDTIYTAIDKISEDVDLKYPPLTINWSSKNKPLRGDVSRGEITTTHYRDGNLYVLGDENSDTDEFDPHVVLHEFAHYFEYHFSRFDNIGGAHSIINYLDIRVAFSEGLANAFSAYILDNPIYTDSYGYQQSKFWSMDIENVSIENSGWFNEASMHKIIYDILDSENERRDYITISFKEFYDVLATNKETKAFNSIFTFIDTLLKQNPDLEDDINTLLQEDNIAPIKDIYGSGRENKSDYYPYRDLNLEEEIVVIVRTDYGTFNKLGNREFLKVHIESDGYYTLKVEGELGDPDIYIYQVSPWNLKSSAKNSNSSEESLSLYFEAGDYIIEIYDYSQLQESRFKVLLTAN